MGLITPHESTMRRTLRAFLHRAVRKLADRLGYITLWRTYYIPVPDFASLSEETWARRSRLGGVRWNLDDHLTWLQEVCLPVSQNWASAAAAAPAIARNGGFDGADAALLYAMVRAGRPTRIIELGAGYSTLVIATAVRELLTEGVTVRYSSFDPHPPDTALAAADVVRVEPVAAQALPSSEFAALGAGDILFVDTTHTVQLGGEVNRIILDLLPTLAQGVLVHFHDVFLPYEYPRDLVEGLSYLWAEQYMLQAFLQFNDSFGVLCGLAALQRERASEMFDLGFGAPPRASSLWLRRLKT